MYLALLGVDEGGELGHLVEGLLEVLVVGVILGRVLDQGLEQEHVARDALDGHHAQRIEAEPPHEAARAERLDELVEGLVLVVQRLQELERTVEIGDVLYVQLQIGHLSIIVSCSGEKNESEEKNEEKERQEKHEEVPS